MELEGEDRSDGRVLLSKFYAPFLAGEHNFFSESPDYLRSLGSLDESEPSKPRVIVPNIIYGRQFCLAADFQSFCCIDQCNILMESLERAIARPFAPPSLIADLVSALPSDTVAAPRILSGALRRKLDTIAAQHGGRVPLHGRLFAQWMHHAYPNECAQPSAPGAEAPMTHMEWSESRNRTTMASVEEIELLSRRAGEADREKGAVEEKEVGGAGRSGADEDEVLIPWSDEEELVSDSFHGRGLLELGDEEEHPQRAEGKLRGILRFAAMCGATWALVGILLNALRAAAPRSSSSKPKGLIGAPQEEKGFLRWLGDRIASHAAGKDHFV